MKTTIGVILLVMLAGCRSLSGGNENSLTMEERRHYQSISQLIVKSPTYVKLQNTVKNSDFLVGIPDGDWVWVDIGAVSTDFFHRWATLKINTQTGAILRLVPDAADRDEYWVDEYEPPKLNVK